MHWLLAVIAVIVSLILVVGVHELGHALVANYFGVMIRKISIGFGKPLVRWQDRKGRKWIWSMWPVGGYVELLDSRTHLVTASQYKYCFDKKPFVARILILLAGIAINLAIAWLALTFYFLIGHTQNSPLIATVRPNSIASASHIAPGEQITRVGKYETPSWQEVGMQLIINFGKHHVPITLKTPTDQIHQTHIDLKHWDNRYHTHSMLSQIGLIPDYAKYHQRFVKGLSIVPAMSTAWHTMGTFLHFYLAVLKKIITHAIPFFLLLGPLGILSNIIDSFAHGVAVFLYFIAQFNLVVALFNLLPIPTLDGGAIIYTIIEKIRGKTMSLAAELLIYRLVLIAFGLILVQLVLNDLKYYFG